MESWELLGSIETVPENIICNLSDPKVVQFSLLPDRIRDRVNDIDSTVKHIVKDQKGCIILLERYGKSYCVCWFLVGLSLKDISPIYVEPKRNKTCELEKDWNLLRFRELLNYWQENSSDRALGATNKLDMKLADSHVQPTQINIDPEKYLETKYYEYLFFIHLPLAYFVKSNLERLKYMCKALAADRDPESYRQHLYKQLLSNKDFDQRHEGGILLGNLAENSVAAETKDTALRKYHIVKEVDDTLLQDYSTIIRIREIKVQIIFLLELIFLEGLDSEFKNFEDNYRSKLKARSLNLTRLVSKSSRRNRFKEKEKPKGSEQKFDYCEQLDLYLDKLCIVDVLLASEPFKVDNEADVIREHKQSLLNRNKEASSLGFANLVLAPYFTRKTPNALRFIVHKLKGPNLKNKRSSSKKTAAIESDQYPAEYSTMASRIDSVNFSLLGSTPSSPDSFRTPLSTHHSLSPKPDFVSSKTVSNLDGFFEAMATVKRAPSFISRTSSDLAMNHLQKRQLSVTEFTSQKSLSAGRALPASVKRSFSGFTSPQQSFCRVGKRKIPGQLSRSTSSVTADHEVNSVQVMSTPLKRSEKVPTKRATLHNIVESPSNVSNVPKGHQEQVESSSLPVGSPPVRTNSEAQAASKKVVRRRLFAP